MSTVSRVAPSVMSSPIPDPTAVCRDLRFCGIHACSQFETRALGHVDIFERRQRRQQKRDNSPMTVQCLNTCARLEPPDAHSGRRRSPSSPDPQRAGLDHDLDSLLASGATLPPLSFPAQGQVLELPGFALGHVGSPSHVPASLDSLPRPSFCSCCRQLKEATPPLAVCTVDSDAGGKLATGSCSPPLQRIRSTSKVQRGQHEHRTITTCR